MLTTPTKVEVSIVEGTLSSIDVLKSFKEGLKRREHLIKMFCECQMADITKDPYKGKLGIYEGKEYVITGMSETDDTTTLSLTKLNRSILKFDQEISVSKDDIANLSSNIKTKVGRFVANYLLLADPFGSEIPFIDDLMDAGKIEKLIVEAALSDKITVEQIHKYSDNVYFLGHFTELCVPSISAKSTVTSPEVKKRREELLKKHKDELDDPVVMAKIEDELIALDKKYIENDPSYGFYGTKGKNFNVSRKRMYGTTGMVEGLGGEYTYIGKPLDEGWDAEDFPTLSNDTRRGIYGRAMDTAKGGEESKFLSRIFQDSKIVEKNCGTKQGLVTVLSEDVIDKYLYRNIITKNGVVTLTKDNIQSYKNKTVVLRSPMYCKSKAGYCTTCMGSLFEKLDVEALGLIAVTIGSDILSISMAAMHGKKVAYTKVESLDEFII